jgi:hypothetical protein
MDPALQRLLHNKPFLVGAAAVAGLGGFVLYRRRSAGAAATGAAASASAPAGGPAGGVGGFNSTGTDVASWLGSYSGSLQNQLDQYTQQLTGALSGLQAMGSQAPPSPMYPTSVVVPKGTLLYPFGERYGKQISGFDFAQLRALNPGIDRWINWYDSPTPGGALTPYLNDTGTVRLA